MAREALTALLITTREGLGIVTDVDLRDKVVPALYRLRADQRCCPSIRIAEECQVDPNILLYSSK